MPGDNGFWFDNDQDVAPSRPKPTQQNPKYPILHSQPRARMFSVKHAQLLAQGKNFKSKIAARTEEGAEASKRSAKEGNHEPAFIINGDSATPAKYLCFQSYGILATDNSLT
jgi:hypothetical protein